MVATGSPNFAEPQAAQARPAPSRGRIWPAVVALVGAVLGLTFGSLSSTDYIQHLDRQVHDVHCSYVPGLGAESSPDNACRVAMYSPYAALFRDKFWGGIPISLFAVGCFSFFVAFALYLLLANRRAPKRALLFLAVFSFAPVAASITMGTISALELGHFCKTCVGIYISSGLLAVGGIGAFVLSRERVATSPARPWNPGRGGVSPTVADGDPSMAPGRPDGPFWLVPLWALALGACAALPALIYASALPSYSSYIRGCGKLEKTTETTGALIHVAPAGAVQPATMFVDPLCPTCKAFDQRLRAEHLLDKLDVTLVLFPLDADCNWMLQGHTVHPGACIVSRAIICSEHKAMQVLDWSYDHQEEILEAAKAAAGSANVNAMIRQRWPGLEACMASKETSIRQDNMLRYIISNKLEVSTPQLFLGETRLCDEDTDMGLAFAIRRLAPALAETHRR